MFRDYWKNFYRKAIESPLSAISTVFAFILTISGLIAAVFSVSQYISLVFGFVFAWMIVVCIICIMMIYVDKNLSNVYKVSQAPKYIYQNVIQKWKIDDLGNRSVYCKKILVFFEKPQEVDLVDTILGSLSLSYDDLRYSSPDADVLHYIQVRDDAINVYWRPKSGEIQVGDSYIHEFEYVFPCGDGAVPKSTTVASIAPVRRLEMSITTEIPLRGLSVQENSEFIDFWNSEKIFVDHSKKLVSPIKAATTKGVDLLFENIRPGQSYFVKFEFIDIE